MEAWLQYFPLCCSSEVPESIGAGDEVVSGTASGGRAGGRIMLMTLDEIASKDDTESKNKVLKGFYVVVCICIDYIHNYLCRPYYRYDIV